MLNSLYEGERKNKKEKNKKREGKTTTMKKKNVFLFFSFFIKKTAAMQEARTYHLHDVISELIQVILCRIKVWSAICAHRCVFSPGPLGAGTFTQLRCAEVMGKYEF